MHSTTTKRKSYPSDRKGEPTVYAYRYYHCNSSHLRDGKCTARRMTAEPLEEVVFGSLLELVGHAELTGKRLIPGRDYSEEIAKVAETIGHLSQTIAIGQATRKDVSADQAALEHAQAELSRLASLEPVPARVEPVSMGKTFGQHWDSLDPVGRNEFLRSAGVRAVASRDQMPRLDMPGGPMTPGEIPRSVIIDREDIHVVIDLGGLRDLLERASAA